MYFETTSYFKVRKNYEKVKNIIEESFDVLGVCYKQKERYATILQS